MYRSVNKIEIVPANMLHAIHIASRMRKEDMEEVAAASGRGPFSALRDSLDTSVASWTGMVGSEPACMFGVSPLDILGGIGCPWLLGTDLIERYQISFLRRNKDYVTHMLDIFPTLVNYVDDRNKLSIRWLTWLGFEFGSTPVPYGVWGLPFWRFEMRRK